MGVIKNPKVHVILTQDELARFRRAARDMGVSMSALFRIAARAYLHKGLTLPPPKA